MTKEQALRLRPGEKIRCIDERPKRTAYSIGIPTGLIKNKRYTFLSLSPRNASEGDDHIRIKVSECEGYIYYLFRFELAFIKQIEII